MAKDGSVVTQLCRIDHEKFVLIIREEDGAPRLLVLVRGGFTYEWNDLLDYSSGEELIAAVLERIEALR